MRAIVFTLFLTAPVAAGVLLDGETFALFLILWGAAAAAMVSSGFADAALLTSDANCDRFAPSVRGGAGNVEGMHSCVRRDEF